MTVLPGFVDIHMHGCAGADVGTADTAALRHIARTLVTHGEAAFLPTVPAASPEQTQHALAAIARAMEEQRVCLPAFYRNDARADAPARQSLSEAVILGAHLEGPFLLPAYKGALDADAFLEATQENWQKLVGPYASVVRRMTVDPLVAGMEEMIPYWIGQEISVSVGHTAADCGTVQRAFRLGANSVTHIFNAMPPLHHREPGPVGAALADDASYAELILDFLHVSPEAAKLVIKAKGTSRVAVITDSCEAAGMPDGPYTLCGRPIRVVNGEARMADGRLASSTVFMDREYRHVRALGFSDAEAAQLLHTNPLCAAGIDPAMRARVDRVFVELDADGAVRDCFVSSRVTM